MKVTVLDAILKLLQFLILPVGIIMAKYLKKQNTIAKDMNDVKFYVKEICESHKIPCILKVE